MVERHDVGIALMQQMAMGLRGSKGGCGPRLRRWQKELRRIARSLLREVGAQTALGTGSAVPPEETIEDEGHFPAAVGVHANEF